MHQLWSVSLGDLHAFCSALSSRIRAMSGLTEELTLILRKSGSQILYDECVFPGKCQIPSVQVQIHDKHDYGSEMSQCFAPSDLFRR